MNGAGAEQIRADSPPPMPQVQANLDTLEKCLSELSQCISDVCDRLTPVRGAQPHNATSPGGPEAPTDPHKISDRIQCSVEHTNRLIHHLRHLQQELEV